VYDVMLGLNGLTHTIMTPHTSDASAFAEHVHQFLQCICTIFQDSSVQLVLDDLNAPDNRLQNKTLLTCDT
jgi:hypothetical protein